MKFLSVVTHAFVIMMMAFAAQGQVKKLVGAGELGAIYKVEGDHLVVLKQLNGNQTPENIDLLISNGRFWGTTQLGGEFNSGVIFSINTAGTDYKVVHNFSEPTGAFPFGGLTEFDGKIWGTATKGGSTGNGVIFSVNPDGTDYDVVHNFTSQNQGSEPGEKMIVLNGRLWGVTRSGGVSDAGTIFSYSPQSGFQKWHDFNGTDGRLPFGKLLASSGRIWGVTLLNATFSSGIIFSIKEDGTDFRVDYEFTSSTGINPGGGLIESNGRLLSATLTGKLYSLNLNGEDFIINYNFLSGDLTNGGPHGALQSSGGKLWGATGGLIYSVKEDGSEFERHHEFSDSATDGIGAWCTLVEYNGRFWGGTSTGGTSGSGILFSIADDGSDYKIEHNFNDAVPIGWNPNSNFIDSDSYIIGTAATGGNRNYGVIYSLKKDGSEYNVLHHFDNEDGTGPRGLVKYGDKLWGTTAGGGVHRRGTIFSINPDGTNFTKVVDFDPSIHSTPVGKLLAVDGWLWGITTNGNGGGGSIFRYNPESGNIENKHGFQFATGIDPGAGMTLANGKLWGVAGGAGGGVVYSIDLSGDNYTVAHTFDSGTGSVEVNNGLIAADGKLWGTTSGQKIFSIDDDGNNFVVRTNGVGSSKGSLTFFNDRLYGANVNSIFSIDLHGEVFRNEVSLASGQSFGFDGGELTPIAFTVPPPAPSNLTATAVTQTSIHVSWTDNSDNETGFEVSRSSNDTDYTVIHTTSPDVIVFTNDDLTPATMYSFRVKATNEAGASDDSNEVTVTTLPNTPAAPGDLKVKGITQTSITLSWADNSNNETGFEIFRSSNGSDYIAIHTTDSDVTSFIDDALTIHTSYFYYVAAINEGGLSPATIVINVTTLPNPPTAPTGLTVDITSGNEIQLTWTHNSNNETGFEIYRSVGSNSRYELLFTATAKTSIDADVIPGTKYFYKVLATNGGGKSGFSNEVEAEILVTGLNEITVEELTVYPNPFTEVITIGNYSGADLQLSAYNSIGVEIGKYYLFSRLELNVNCTEWPVGIYILRDVNGVSSRRINKR